jgi:cysteine desulfurase
MHGAGHESGRRAGTENVILDVGLGAACDVARQWIGMPKVRELRDYFWTRLKEIFGDRVHLNGHPEKRLPNTLNVAFPGRVGSEILAQLDGLAATTGSACHAGSVTLSPVLKAMAVPPEVGMGAIRFSLGRATTQNELDTVVSRLAGILNS